MVRRLPFIVVMALIMGLVMAPLVLAVEETTDEAPAETQVVDESQIQPAVEIVEEPEEAGEDEWTFRYLVPTAILLAVLAVAITVIQYFVKVTKARYRVVE